MSTHDAPLLLALSDCLAAGEGLSRALARVATVGGPAPAWAEQVRRASGPEVTVADALRAAHFVDDDEHTLLASSSDEGIASRLELVVARRERRTQRASALRAGLYGPLALAALTIVLDPLPNLVTDGPYVLPVVLGLFALALAAGFVLVGLPLLLRRPAARDVCLRTCAAVPGPSLLARLAAEEELTLALAGWAKGGAVAPEGLGAASRLVSWSAAGAALGQAMRSPNPSPGPLGGLEVVAPHVSLETRLAVVGGVAAERLPERLRDRSETLSGRLTLRLRWITRIAAYGLVVAVSVHSLVNLFSRGLPGMPLLPGGDPTQEQKDLEELLKQLQP